MYEGVESGGKIFVPTLTYGHETEVVDTRGGNEFPLKDG